jgi:hypothetical protein
MQVDASLMRVDASHLKRARLSLDGRIFIGSSDADDVLQEYLSGPWGYTQERMGGRIESGS